jgi:hypothetical protein
LHWRARTSQIIALPISSRTPGHRLSAIVLMVPRKILPERGFGSRAP